VQDILVDKIARVDPETGAVEEYDIPYNSPLLLNVSKITGRLAFACAIQPGEDGNLYAASGVRNQFLRINPTTKNITVFTPTPLNPLGDLQPFNDLYRGPTGVSACYTWRYSKFSQLTSADVPVGNNDQTAN